MAVDAWASDCAPSIPAPMRNPSTIRVVLDMGFAFTDTGLVHDLTEDEWEAQLFPTYAPEGVIPQSGTIHA